MLPTNITLLVDLDVKVIEIIEEKLKVTEKARNMIGHILRIFF